MATFCVAKAPEWQLDRLAAIETILAATKSQVDTSPRYVVYRIEPERSAGLKIGCILTFAQLWQGACHYGSWQYNTSLIRMIPELVVVLDESALIFLKR